MLQLADPNLRLIKEELKFLPRPFNIGIHEVPASPLVRGRGNVWPISGWIEGDLKNIIDLKIEINGVSSRPLEAFRVQHEVDDIAFFGNTLLPQHLHFVHLINSQDVRENTLEISIVITTNSGVSQIDFTNLIVVDHIQKVPDTLPKKKIVICMATYNPNLTLFKNQLDSIYAQSEKSWHLVINDDCSDTKIFRAMCDMLLGDDRVTVYQNKTNKGFYHNFEECLYRIHSQFDYVALADQDDIWHPQKLEYLLANIGSSSLIYNDMDIVSDEGEIISNTFWNNRSNHYHSLSTLFLANTVTGSASLFQSNLLSTLLPFPERLGNAFHDHWMALTAAISGGLSYHDAVCQTYIQHNSNVTGYGQFEEIDLRQSTLSLLSLQRMKASVALDANSPKNRLFVRNNIKVYFDAYLRRKLQYRILLARHPHTGRKRLDRIYNSKNKAIKELLTLHWKIYKNRWMTNNAELSYINAIEVMKQITVKFNHTIE